MFYIRSDVCVFVASLLQSMFQASHSGKGGVYDPQGAKMKKKPNMMLHSDPSILGKQPIGQQGQVCLGQSQKTWFLHRFGLEDFLLLYRLRGMWPMMILLSLRDVLLWIYSSCIVK